MRRILLSLLTLPLLFTSAKSQKENFTYNFYGFVRGDLYYNSRENYETVDGLFYLYPKDIERDPNGKDLNANPNSAFYTLMTRLGLDVTGPRIGAASTSARIEADFAGSTNVNFKFRIRHAYVRLHWEKGSTLLLGQTWHPLFGEVSPKVQNVGTGSPFQPFNRSPQINYKYNKGGFELTASALYQLIYKSEGPNGKSEEYLKNGVIPEFYVGVDYMHQNWLAGIGVDMISLKPRTEAVVDEKTYKVSERVTTFSYEAHAKYTTSSLYLAAKTILASNLTHTSMLGGYAVKATDPVTGEQDYTPFRHSTTWINAVYGEKWKTGIFAGFTKNLGTADAITGATYGSGVDIDRLLSGALQASYNLPHWSVGLEYSLSNARYGTVNSSDGKVKDTHGVTNHRILCTMFYRF